MGKSSYRNGGIADVQASLHNEAVPDFLSNGLSFSIRPSRSWLRVAFRTRVCPAAILVDDWNTLRRATEPGALRTHLAEAMEEEGLVTDEELFLDAFDYAAAFHRSMTERDLREHTVEQVLSLARYTLGEPAPPTAP